MGKGEKDTKASKNAKQSKNTNDNGDSENNGTVPIYKCNNVDFSRTLIGELNTDGKQSNAYINYEDPTLNAETKILVKTGKIKITCRGVPRLDPQFHPTNDKREFIEIPLDPEQPDAVRLREHLEKGDEYFGSEETRKKLFGKHASKYVYSPMVKIAKKKDDDDSDSEEDKKSKKKGKGKDNNDKKKSYPNHDYVRMKFNFYVKEDERVNVTKLKRINGKTKTVVKAQTMDDIEREIRFLSEIRLIFHYGRIWANKAAAPGSDKKLYGVGLKVIAIDYTPPASKGLPIDRISVSSSDEEDDDSESVKPQKKTQKLDSESSEEVKPSKKDMKKNTKEDSDDEGDDSGDKDDSEDDVPKKSSKKDDKKSKKKTNDSDEDDEDDVPKKSSKKDDKKSSKKQKDDDDDEEEEIKPKKSSLKGKSASKTK